VSVFGLFYINVFSKLKIFSIAAVALLSLFKPYYAFLSPLENLAKS